MQSKPLNVDVVVRGQSKAQDGTAVVAPTAAAPVVATVKDGSSGLAGVEVTFIAVDEAILDLIPYDLQVRNSSIRCSEMHIHSRNDGMQMFWMLRRVQERRMTPKALLHCSRRT